MVLGSIFFCYVWGHHGTFTSAQNVFKIRILLLFWEGVASLQPDGMLKKSETTLDQKGKMYMTGGPTDANQVIDLDNHITVLIERL